MDEDTLNMSVRKYLKKLGVTSQREIEAGVRDQLAAGSPERRRGAPGARPPSSCAGCPATSSSRGRSRSPDCPAAGSYDESPAVLGRRGARSSSLRRHVRRFRHAPPALLAARPSPPPRPVRAGAGGVHCGRLDQRRGAPDRHPAARSLRSRPPSTVRSRPPGEAVDDGRHDDPPGAPARAVAVRRPGCHGARRRAARGAPSVAAGRAHDPARDRPVRPLRARRPRARRRRLRAVLPGPGRAGGAARRTPAHTRDRPRHGRAAAHGRRPPGRRGRDRPARRVRARTRAPARPGDRPRQALAPRRAHRLLRRAAADRRALPLDEERARGARQRAGRGGGQRPRRGPRTASSAARASCSRSTCRSHGPDGQPLLFEVYQRFSSVAGDAASGSGRTSRPRCSAACCCCSSCSCRSRWSLARRLRRGQAEREALLHRAIDASRPSGGASPPTSTTASSRTSRRSRSPSRPRPSATDGRRRPRRRAARGAARSTRAQHPRSCARCSSTSTRRTSTGRASHSALERPRRAARGARADDARGRRGRASTAAPTPTSARCSARPRRRCATSLKHAEADATSRVACVRARTARAGCWSSDDGRGLRPAEARRPRRRATSACALLGDLAARRRRLPDIDSAPGRGHHGSRWRCRRHDPRPHRRRPRAWCGRASSSSSASADDIDVVGTAATASEAVAAGGRASSPTSC